MKKVVFIVLFVLFLIMVPIISLTTFDKPFLYYENRWVAAMPEYNKEDLYSGKYLNCLDAFLSERIILRDNMMAAGTSFKLSILGKTVVGDVVIGDNVLLPYHLPSNANYSSIQASIDECTQNVEKIAAAVDDAGAKFMYVGIPEQSSVFRDRYPAHLNSNTKVLEFIENGFFAKLEEYEVENINFKDVFENEDVMRLYSKTDHHFNYYGAFEVYKEIINTLGHTPLDEDELLFEEVDMPFLGSRNRKLFNAYNSADKLIIANPKIPVTFWRYDNGKRVADRLFEINKDDEYITYNAYMGGDFAETIIKTNRPHLPRLLIVGDSFTNPLETLLYLNFDETRSLDYRYYSEKNIAEYLSDYTPDIVLMIRDDINYLHAGGNGNCMLE